MAVESGSSRPPSPEAVRSARLLARSALSAAPVAGRKHPSLEDEATQRSPPARPLRAQEGSAESRAAARREPRSLRAAGWAGLSGVGGLLFGNRPHSQRRPWALDQRIRWAGGPALAEVPQLPPPRAAAVRPIFSFSVFIHFLSEQRPDRLRTVAGQSPALRRRGRVALFSPIPRPAAGAPPIGPAP